PFPAASGHGDPRFPPPFRGADRPADASRSPTRHPYVRLLTAAVASFPSFGHPAPPLARSPRRPHRLLTVTGQPAVRQLVPLGGTSGPLRAAIRRNGSCRRPLPAIPPVAVEADSRPLPARGRDMVGYGPPCRRRPWPAASPWSLALPA